MSWRKTRAMTTLRRWDLRPLLGMAVVAIVMFVTNKLDGITFVMFLFIGACGSVGATWRLRSRNESDPSL